MPSDAEFVLVLTTFPADGDAESLARTLVQEGLAACVNILPPMVSIYRWQGAIERADERQLVIKTTAARIRELESRIKALHSYDVPEFVVLSIVAGSPDYLSWLAQT
ncbi:MAG TPA: divalent-cation tolerance protein CutA [Vicinamibacterales bacterium]|nr:divalent-cation tolerance protein CutA [Vicinamibacterales bacterium]